jgi:REP element-mobilizing transposase RayT
MSEYEWDDNEFPLAYFITFRTHGTWLHGDQRGSVDRHGRNIYATEHIKLDPVFSVTMDRNMRSKPLLLNGRQRGVVDAAIRDVCVIREYGLIALNVRTNHAHAVVSALTSPNRIMSAFKANATRELRKAGLVELDTVIWSRGGSTRYLWKPRNVERAAEYTINGQGDDLPDF